MKTYNVNVKYTSTTVNENTNTDSMSNPTVLKHMAGKYKIKCNSKT